LETKQPPDQEERMSKSVIRVMMVTGLVAVVTALAAPVFAEDAPAKPDQNKPRQYTGDIVSVDATKSVIVVTKKKDDQKTFSVTDRTKITIGNKEVATLAELKADDRVTVSFVEDGDKNVATRINPAKAKKKTAEDPK